MLVRHAGKSSPTSSAPRGVGPSHTEQAHYARVYMAHLRHKLGSSRRGRLSADGARCGYRLAARIDAGESSSSKHRPVACRAFEMQYQR